MANSIVLRRSSEPERDHQGKVGGEENDDDGDREKDPRPPKRRRIGSLHCVSRRSGPSSSLCSFRSATTRQRRCQGREAGTTQKPVVPRHQPRPCPSERLLLTLTTDTWRCSTMTLCTPPPSPATGPSSRRAAGIKLIEVLPSTKIDFSKADERKVLSKATTRAPSLRKLLPKIGFDWAVCETRNRHTRKIERLLAGLEGRERRAILRALSTSFSGDGRNLDKKRVEKGLVEVFEGSLGVVRGDEMKMRGLKDQSLFWEEVISHSPSAWFSQGEITGEIIHGLVLLTVEARLWDKEHGVEIGWMDTARGRSKLVKVVNEFVRWLEENEEEGVKRGYFGGIEGALHLDFFGGKKHKEAREMLELFRTRYVVEDMEVDVDFEELLAEELGDLMARLAIDADEEMVDVDWENWEWWMGGEGGDEGIL